MSWLNFYKELTSMILKCKLSKKQFKELDILLPNAQIQKKLNNLEKHLNC
jgi:hypothetical protein